MDFDKITKAIQWRKDNLFNKWYGSNWTPSGKNELWHKMQTLYKNQHNYIMNLYVKILEIKSWKNLQDLGVGNKFPASTPQSTILKGKVDVLDFIKMKNFCFTKNLRGRSWDLFANHISDQSRTFNSKDNSIAKDVNRLNEFH